MPRQHELPATPENIAWGYIDAARPAVLRVASGDTVRLASWAAAREADLPPDRSLVQAGHLEALHRCPPGPTSHMITGPVHVEGAEPGDVLQIDILEVTPIDRWGWTAIRNCATPISATTRSWSIWRRPRMPARGGST